MHKVIRNAVKAAGIDGGFTKCYPDDPKQRSCGHIAAFAGSIANDCAKADEEREDLLKQIADLSKELKDAKEELRRTDKRAMKNGVGVISAKHHFTESEVDEAQKLIVG